MFDQLELKSAKQSGAIGLGWASLLAAVLVGPRLWGSENVGEELTRNSVRLALACWTLAVAGMLWRNISLGGSTRLLWTLGCLTFVIHVAIAFHYYHAWSHGKAYRHVEDSSGFGPGIFVSYFFTLAWVSDVVWWWASPSSYAGRAVWITWGLHGFMGFLWFNGTVVYERGPIRWAGLAVFAFLGALLLLRLRKQKCAD
jgi:hypothetical protein